VTVCQIDGGCLPLLLVWQAPALTSLSFAMSDAGSRGHMNVALAAGAAALAALLLHRHIQRRLGVASAELNGYITPDKLLMHRSAASIWIVIDGTVYDVTKFIKVHPGGRGIPSRLLGAMQQKHLRL